MILHVTKVTVIEVDVLSVEENYFIVDSEGAAYSGDYSHGFNAPLYIHIHGWCVVDYPVQWYVEVETLVVLLCLVVNNGRHDRLPIG